MNCELVDAINSELVDAMNSELLDAMNSELIDAMNSELVDAMNSELIDETNCELDCQEDYQRIGELIPNKTTRLLVSRVWDHQIFGVTVCLGDLLM